VNICWLAQSEKMNTTAVPTTEHKCSRKFDIGVKSGPRSAKAIMIPLPSNTMRDEHLFKERQG
jgi:hypothetical protein